MQTPILNPTPTLALDTNPNRGPLLLPGGFFWKGWDLLARVYVHDDGPGRQVFNPSLNT